MQRSLQQLAYDIQEDNIDLLAHRPDSVVHTRMGSLRSRAPALLAGSALRTPRNTPCPRSVFPHSVAMKPSISDGSTPTSRIVCSQPPQRIVSSDNHYSGTWIPLEGFDEVSVQVSACKDKADTLANSMDSLQARMELVLHKLDCQGAHASGTRNGFHPPCEMKTLETRARSDIALEKAASPSELTVGLPPSSAHLHCSLPSSRQQQHENMQAESGPHRKFQKDELEIRSSKESL